MEKHWTNYGDVNWKDHGGIFMKEDEDTEGYYHYVEVQPTTGEGEPVYLLSELYVSVEDIAHPKDVASYGGYDSLNEALADVEHFIMDAVHYWGVEQLGGTMTVRDSWWDVLTELSAWDIVDDVRKLNVSSIEGHILVNIAERMAPFIKGSQVGISVRVEEIAEDLKMKNFFYPELLDEVYRLTKKGYTETTLINDEELHVTLKGKALALIQIV